MAAGRPGGRALRRRPRCARVRALLVRNDGPAQGHPPFAQGVPPCRQGLRRLRARGRRSGVLDLAPVLRLRPGARPARAARHGARLGPLPGLARDRCRDRPGRAPSAGGALQRADGLPPPARRAAPATRGVSRRAPLHRRRRAALPEARRPMALGGGRGVAQPLRHVRDLLCLHRDAAAQFRRDAHRPAASRRGGAPGRRARARARARAARRAVGAPSCPGERVCQPAGADAGAIPRRLVLQPRPVRARRRRASSCTRGAPTSW